MMNKKGFTLVEIIAVTLIIAVLALLVVPSFKNSALTNQMEKAKIGLVELNMAVKLYREVNPNTFFDGFLNEARYNLLCDTSQGYSYLPNPARWGLNENTNTYSLKDGTGVLNCKYKINAVSDNNSCEVTCKFNKVDSTEFECYKFYIEKENPAVVKKTTVGVTCDEL